MEVRPVSYTHLKAQVAALTAAAYAVKQAVQIPVGLDAAFNDCEADIAIAAMVGASFIRVPVFVDTVLFTDGIIQPCAKKCMESVSYTHLDVYKRQGSRKSDSMRRKI